MLLYFLVYSIKKSLSLSIPKKFASQGSEFLGLGLVFVVGVGKSGSRDRKNLVSAYTPIGLGRRTLWLAFRGDSTLPQHNEKYIVIGLKFGPVLMLQFVPELLRFAQTLQRLNQFHDLSIFALGVCSLIQDESEYYRYGSIQLNCKI